MSAKAAKVRLAVVIDWDAGLPIAGPCEPVDDVLPGGQYTVECSPQEQVLIQEIEIRSFALAWIAVGGHEIKPIGTVQGTSEIRRYLLEEPVFVRAAETVSMGLKNDGGWSLKPKIAMFARLPPSATNPEACADCQRIAEADGDILPPACPAHGGRLPTPVVLQPPPAVKRNPLDPREQFAAAIGARRVCEWCAPHFRARLEGRVSDHTRCDDLHCGCHCQDPLKVN
jgi:hypothetical protein